MRRQNRTIRPGSRIVLIVLGLFFCTFAIVEFNRPEPTIVGPAAFVPAPPAKSAQADDPEEAAAYKIVIDPGHGGIDPGASSISGVDEKDYTLALARKVYDLFKQDPQFEPYMTRTDDTSVALEDRGQMANDQEADVFVSIHGNTYTDSGISGTETYYYTEQSKRLADDVHATLIAADGFKDRGVRYENWKVLTVSQVPSILAEIGYLTNKGDEAVLLDSGGQDRIAQAIVDGIKQFLLSDGDRKRE